MGAWRVIRTYIRGQWENDACFLKWIGSHPAEIAIAKVVPIPAIQELAVPYHDTFKSLYPFLSPDDFGSKKPSANDQQLYIVYQAADVATPNCANGNPSLVSSGGKVQWDTQAEAQAVVDAELGQRNAIAAQVKAANEKAVSAGNIAASVAKDAGKAVDAASKAVSSPWFAIGLAGLGLGLLAWVFRR